VLRCFQNTYTSRLHIMEPKYGTFFHLVHHIPVQILCRISTRSWRALYRIQQNLIPTFTHTLHEHAHNIFFVSHHITTRNISWYSKCLLPVWFFFYNRKNNSSAATNFSAKYIPHTVRTFFSTKCTTLHIQTTRVTVKAHIHTT
jgi:hypothetical protein